MYRHLIWDFDGTLYDTYPQMTEALLAALGEFGQTADYNEAYGLIKITLFHAANVYARRFSLPVDALIAAFHVHHAAQTAFPAMPGLESCLTQTKQSGCSHYLFTHRDRRAVTQLEADGFTRYFTGYVTREDGFADKPSPEAVQYLMRRYGFAAGDALMIGDRDIDMGSGQAAGVAGVLLDPGGYYPEWKAEYLIQSLAEVPALIQKG